MPSSENYRAFDRDRTLRQLEVDDIRQGTLQLLDGFRSDARAKALARHADGRDRIDRLRRDVADMRGDADEAVRALAKFRRADAIRHKAALSAYMGGLRAVVVQMKRHTREMVGVIAVARKQTSQDYRKALRSARQDQADLVERQLVAIRQNLRGAQLEQRRHLVAVRADLADSVDELIGAFRKRRGEARRLGRRPVRSKALGSKALGEARSGPVREAGTAPMADDLTRIKGIGPAVAARLEALNVTTFAALAAQDADTLRQQLGGIPLSDIPGWIGAARRLMDAVDASESEESEAGGDVAA